MPESRIVTHNEGPVPTIFVLMKEVRDWLHGHLELRPIGLVAALESQS